MGLYVVMIGCVVIRWLWWKWVYRFIHTARPPSRGPCQLIERVTNTDLLMVYQHVILLQTPVSLVYEFIVGIGR